MANQGVKSVINALKNEVKSQQQLKIIESAFSDIPVKEGSEYESNASFLQRYNEDVHNELLRAIQILEQATSEDNKPVAIGKSDKDSKHETIVKVLEEQYEIQDTLEVISKKGYANAGIKVQVFYEHNEMYKRELGDALDYMARTSESV